MEYDELQIHGVRPGDVEFTNETHGCYNVTRIQEWIRESGLQPFVAVLQPDNIKQMLSKVDIDLDRIQEIMIEMAVTQKMFDPCISIEIPDDDPLLIDGHHRMYVIMQLQHKEIPMYMVPHNVAEAFKVTLIERNSATGETRAVDHKEFLKRAMGKFTDTTGKPRK